MMHGTHSVKIVLTFLILYVFLSIDKHKGVNH
jgi:hypothetical protein